MVKISNIVNVNLTLEEVTRVVGAYDTTLYLANVTIIDPDDGEATVDRLLFTNYEDVETYITDINVRFNAKTYFNNGGSKLLIAKPSAYTLEGFKADIDAARAVTDNFIFVTIQNSLLGSVTYYTTAIVQEIVAYADTTKAPETIRLAFTTNSDSYIEDNGFAENNIVVKYSTKIYETKLVEAALLVGAYFSQIDLDGSNTVRDYCFTPEAIYLSVTTNYGAEGLTQTQYDNLTQNPTGAEGYYNVIDTIGNRVLNFGGNYANGTPIHIDFARICIENDTIYSVLEVMLGKQYLTNTGIANIISAINDRLQRYKTNGALFLGSTYNGEDLKLTYNGSKFDVINKGKVLSQGYYVFYIPIEYISQADKTAKRFTPIKLIIQTQAGAKVIDITGEVLY